MRKLAGGYRTLAAQPAHQHNAMALQPRASYNFFSAPAAASRRGCKLRGAVAAWRSAKSSRLLAARKRHAAESAP